MSNQIDNSTSTLYHLLKRIQAKVTYTTLRETLLQHPAFPSLLSLSEVLTDYQVDNTGLQLNSTEQLRELPFPFIAHLRKKNGWYVLVTTLKNDIITYIDSMDGHKTDSLADFEKQWTGVVLLAEATKTAGETDYATKWKQEFLTTLRRPFILASVGLLLFMAFLNLASGFSGANWLLLLSKSIGLIISILLVANQLGNKNALTDRLCHMNGKTNCDNVLNSPAATLWGWLRWTDVGLLYFAGGWLTVLLVGVLSNYVDDRVGLAAVGALLNGLAVLALPYTLFSVYYQGIVLRQWCTLCLGIQGVLLMEGGWAITQLTSLPTFIGPYLLILTTFLLPAIAWAASKPLLIFRQKSRWEQEELMGLKRNPDLFRALLMNQPQMPPLTEDVHPIVLGNPEASFTITMVTNPYCEPCSKTHTELQQLLRQNEKVKVQVIFWACDGVKGDVHRIARHILALYEEQPTEHYLTDWYEDTAKEIEEWMLTRPVGYDVEGLNDIVDHHCTWCKRAQVDHTPMLFINGFLLPDLYRVSSLRWLINYLPIPDVTMDLAKSK